jgi:hypothetical protein
LDLNTSDFNNKYQKETPQGFQVSKIVPYIRRREENY